MSKSTEEDLRTWFIHNDSQGEALIEPEEWADAAVESATDRFNALMQLIKADREAAVREARIDEIANILPVIDIHYPNNEKKPFYNMAMRLNAYLRRRLKDLNQPTKEG